MDTTELDFELSTLGPLSQAARRKGFERFSALAEYVRTLTYGRVSGSVPVAVLDEEQGTCSSKHALLALIRRRHRTWRRWRSRSVK
jgi:hypothetical protein